MDNEFEWLLGRTITQIEGAEYGSERITFVCDDGGSLSLFHRQDCCETVEVNEIIGDIADLVGSPILQAEETISENEPLEGVVMDYNPESYTWSFYKLATIKGYVTIRWLGESNGYYSETVEIAIKDTPHG